MRHISLICLGSMLMMSMAVAQHHYGGYDYPGAGYFFRRGYNPFSPYLGGYKLEPNGTQIQPEGRQFPTITITVSTSTTTSTSTSTLTCTTWTATLSTCTAGRRRRRLRSSFADGKKFRGLFYKEDEFNDDEMSIFVSNPQDKKEEESSSVLNVESSAARPVRQNLPYMIQPGFWAPDSIGNGRRFLSFYTSTTTSTITTTSTTSLTALCSSVTGWPTCGSSGK